MATLIANVRSADTRSNSGAEVVDRCCQTWRSAPTGDDSCTVASEIQDSGLQFLRRGYLGQLAGKKRMKEPTYTPGSRLLAVSEMVAFLVRSSRHDACIIEPHARASGVRRSGWFKRRPRSDASEDFSLLLLIV